MLLLHSLSILAILVTPAVSAKSAAELFTISDVGRVIAQPYKLFDIAHAMLKGAQELTSTLNRDEGSDESRLEDYLRIANFILGIGEYDFRDGYVEDQLEERNLYANFCY